MTEPDFDVIVVGAGVAGSVTALLLARRGLSVALLERGETPGAKNLSGGIFYCKVMDQVFDNFVSTAPIERQISRNQVCFINPNSSVCLDYRDQRLAEEQIAVSVLRGRLDPWLAQQAEEAGVMVMPGIRVERLLQESGQVVGVEAGEDQLRSRVVVAADGVNSFLARDAGLRDRPPLNHLGLGVKAVMSLPEETINERFNLRSNAGAAMALVGDCTAGIGGGGFLYTNRDTLSIGVVMRLDDLAERQAKADEVFQHLLHHPMLAEYLQGAEVAEYGSHLVAEGGKAMRGRIVHDGLVLVGEAAGLTLNTGFTVRGMDLAAGSAIAAATAIGDAVECGDVSAAGLSAYERMLDQSFVGKDMDTYAKAPGFLETPRLYGDYGKLAADALHGVFCLNTSPRRSLFGTVKDAWKHSPLRLKDLTRDAYKAVKAL